MNDPKNNDQSFHPPPLSRNLISYFGWIITLVFGIMILILIAADLLLEPENPYNSLVTYVLLPGMLLTGIALIFAGIGWEWRRRHRRDPSQYPLLPVVDLNKGWQRRRLLIGIVMLTVLFGFSAIGVYQSYHFTESVVFCGRICHQVMEPEYTAYQFSPHARVSCTECHIGPGANWYVKSKMSGLYQVYSVLTKSYELPIETPVRNLRPARETCEHCHWPEKFSDSVEKEIWHFSPDRANTPVRYNLLLRVGGGSHEAGLGQGIHWHIRSDVEINYWARDEQRLDIPWVEVRIEGAEPRVYRTPDCPDPLPADAEVRRMDCIDCHNRPSHVYRSPHQLVDFYMSTGVFDAALPYFKRYATELLETEWPDTASAMKGIAQALEERYKDWSGGPRAKELVAHNTEWLQKLYRQNFFPDQGVNWRVYPNHLGHFEFPGCMRCHDDRHQADGRQTISRDCNLCHLMLDQAEGAAAYGPITYQGGDFKHPRNMDDIWRDRDCFNCHGVTPQTESPPEAEPVQVSALTSNVPAGMD